MKNAELMRKKIECFEVGKTVPNSDQEMIDIIEALQMDIVHFLDHFSNKMILKLNL